MSIVFFDFFRNFFEFFIYKIENKRYYIVKKTGGKIWQEDEGN